MGNTSIEWTNKTWNPVRGCSVVSEGCRNCYAINFAARFAKEGEPYEGLAYRNESGAHWTGKLRFVQEHLEDPLRWRKPAMIFVNSMSDLFHETVDTDWITRIFNVMLDAPQHTFQVLTKRPERMLDYCTRRARNMKTAPNVWLGVSVEDQKTADERIPLLLNTPAAIRWLSVEPLLGQVDLSLGPDVLGVNDAGRSVDWVVVGGESGPNARPMNPEWPRALRDQCVAAGVPFFFKQWGEWVDYSNVGANTWTFTREISGKRLGRVSHGKADLFDGRDFETTYPFQKAGYEPLGPCMIRAGKKAAGRLLDGREWSEYPKAKAANA